MGGRSKRAGGGLWAVVTAALLLHSAPMPKAQAQTPSGTEDRHADTDFVTRASLANLLAAAESRLAAERAPSRHVKDLARQLLEAHEAAQAALRPAAAAAGTPAPADLDADGRRRLATLDRMGPDAFDEAYLADQLALHSNALKLYGDYMLLGSDEAMKALAIRLIPVTGAQLKAVQAALGP